MVDQYKKNSLVFKHNLKEFWFYQLIPFYFFIFNVFYIIYKILNINISVISNLFITIYFAYFVLLIFSSKYSERNIFKFPIVLLLIFLGNLSIGFGSLISFFGIKKIFSFYKNI